MTDNPRYQESVTAVPAAQPWDVTTDPANPRPLIYPVCKDCGEAWAYQRCLSWTTGRFMWAWAPPVKVPRGCRHKSGFRVHGQDEAVDDR
jgi:hypothetical protein